MVTVKIGGVAKELSDVDQQWLCKRINGLRAAGESDCVLVRIKDEEVDLWLTTPGCGGGGGWRPPRGREPRILELWRKLNLDEPGFSCGNVRAFLAQLERIL